MENNKGFIPKRSLATKNVSLILSYIINAYMPSIFSKNFLPSKAKPSISISVSQLLFALNEYFFRDMI